jgi:hypothetical protein
VSYGYRLRGGGELSVLRGPDKAILSANLSGVPFTGNMGRDFTRSFIGRAFGPSAVSRCVSRASEAGASMGAGTVRGTRYTLGCYRIGGRLIWSADLDYYIGPL